MKHGTLGDQKLRNSRSKGG